jgi:hypothetical protein
MRTNRVIKNRDYVGIENFIKFGVETYHRYNRISYPDKTIAELCEHIDGTWVKLSDAQVEEILKTEL